MPSRGPNSVIAIRSARLRAAPPATLRVFFAPRPGPQPAPPAGATALLPAPARRSSCSAGQAPAGSDRVSWVLPPGPLGLVPLATSSSVRSTGPRGAGAPPRPLVSYNRPPRAGSCACTPPRTAAASPSPRPPHLLPPKPARSCSSTSDPWSPSTLNFREVAVSLTLAERAAPLRPNRAERVLLHATGRKACRHRRL